MVVVMVVVVAVVLYFIHTIKVAVIVHYGIGHYIKMLLYNICINC